ELLHGMLRPLVPFDGPALRERETEEPGVLSGAIIVQRGGAPGMRADVGERLRIGGLVVAAREPALVEPERLQDPGDALDVIAAARGRGGHEGEVLVVEAPALGVAALDEREELEGLRGGAEGRDEVRVLGARDDAPVPAAQSGLEAVARFRDRSPPDED